MNDKTLRHLIAGLVTAAGIVIYLQGYVSGARGWWLTIVTLIGVYLIVYKLVEA